MWKNRKNDNAVDVFEINSQKFASRLILGWGIRLWSQKFNIPKIWPSCCDVIFPYLGKKGTKIEFHFLAKTLWETPKNWYSGWFWDDGSEYELKFWVFLIFHRLLWRHITLFGHKWEKAENFPQIKVKPDKVIILMYKLVWHVFWAARKPIVMSEFRHLYICPLLWRHRSPSLPKMTQNASKTRYHECFDWRIGMGIFFGARKPMMMSEFWICKSVPFCDVTDPQFYPK